MNSLFVQSVARGLFLSFLISVPGRAELAVTELWPTNQSEGVCIDTPLRLTFNEPPVLGNQGKIIIFRATDNKPVDVLDLSAAGHTGNFGGKLLHYEPIQIESNGVSLKLHSHALKPNGTYYITVEPGVFKDGTGSEFGGITNDTMWQFTTREALPRGPDPAGCGR